MRARPRGGTVEGVRGSITEDVVVTINKAMYMYS